MKERQQNQLNMIGVCINVATSTDYLNVWTGNPPLDFGTDLTQLKTGYGAVIAKAAQAENASGGAADAKAGAETSLENSAFTLARALANHFKKNGDLDNLAKVNVTKSQIVKLRNQDLVTKTTEILNLANTAVGQPGAANRGITAARIAVLTAAISSFTTLINSPRGQVVNRGTLIKEVDTDIADLMDQLTDLDDLVLQFDGTDAGKRFIEAWKRARIIVDAGGGHGSPEAPPTPPPTPHL